MSLTVVVSARWKLVVMPQAIWSGASSNLPDNRESPESGCPGKMSTGGERCERTRNQNEERKAHKV